MWKDITYSINKNMPPYPGQPKVKIDHLCSIKEGAASNVTLLNMSAHTGTHMDAPLHFIEEGGDITTLPLDIAIGRGKIIEIFNSESITVDEIQSYEKEFGRIKKEDKIFFKTNNSKTDWSESPFNKNYVYLTKEAAAYLTGRKISMVGIDYLSISKGNINVDVHNILLGNDCWIVEGLDLRDVDTGLYTIVCLPIKIKGADGAPCRVVVNKIEP